MDMFDERELLNYDTYEDYLDSFIQNDDMFYLRNKDVARMVAALGYRLVYYYWMIQKDWQGFTFTLGSCYLFMWMSKWVKL